MRHNSDFYNCGGYALNTFSWFDFDWSHFPFMYFYAQTAEEAHSKIQRLSAELFKMFDDLRPIKSIKELQENEYAIAFRISCKKSNPDFHFLKRGANGVWYEKRGRLPDIQVFPKEELFAPKWHDTYGYEIAFFAKKLAKSA